jgi:hypothetical protein
MLFAGKIKGSIKTSSDSPVNVELFTFSSSLLKITKSHGILLPLVT